MDCSICKKELTQETGPHCPSCARNTLYTVRLELARTLLEKEQLGRKVEAIVGPEPEQPLDEELAKLRAAWQSQLETVEVQQTHEENAELERQLLIKKKEVQLNKARAQELRRLIAEKKANLQLAREALAKGQKQSDELREALAKGTADFNALHGKIVDAKAVLCREAASLMRLRHTKRKAKDGTIRDRYSIAGLPLPDLKDINSKSLWTAHRRC